MGTSRRTFFKQLAVASAASIVTPALLCSGTVLAADGFPVMSKPRKIKPSEKVNLACVGTGFRGSEIILWFAATGLANVVALCDVDLDAPHTKMILNKFPKAKRFQDFRVMFEKMGDNIDAVCIGTPDHSHFPIAMLAMRYGKHVYSEKPLGRTFQENTLLMEMAKRNPQLVTQMGNQGHSEANYFQFQSWVDNGIIKDVTAITAHMNGSRRWHKWNPKTAGLLPAEPIPPTMDWDIWPCGCMPRNYNKDYVNGQWRCWYDFGMGALGDWGAHLLDTAHQFLKLGLPYEVDPIMLKGHNDFFFPMASTIAFRFPERGDRPACDITWYDGVDNQPPLPEGFGASNLDPNIPVVAGETLKAAKLNPGKIIYSKELTFKGGSHGSILEIIPAERAKEMENKLPEYPETTSNHYKNFLLACKGEELARSPFEVAAPLSQVFCLGVLAQRLGTKLCFDRETQRITNNQLADAMLAPTPRLGWEEYYKL